MLRAAEHRSLTLPEAGELEAVTGRGLRSRIGERRVMVGRLLMFEEGAEQPPAEVREAGIERIVMLTGDNAGVGTAVAQSVGIDEVRVAPRGQSHCDSGAGQEGSVAMVGDGVNDAQALAHATVGIAMGGAGTAAALETADVALMGDDLDRLRFAIGMSRQARAVIKQNLAIALGVARLLPAATATGVVGIGVAMVVHEGSTLVVIVNALRLLTYDDK